MRENFLGSGFFGGKEEVEKRVKEARCGGDEEKQDECEELENNVDYCDTDSKENDCYGNSNDDSNDNRNDLKYCDNKVHYTLFSFDTKKGHEQV